MTVLLLFFLSGATALIYEVVWSKYLALMFGSTVQAQTVVLAVFMGGLALGNRLFGARATRLAQPLAAYGYVELAIGLYAFFFPFTNRAADSFFISVGSNFADNSGALLALKAVIAVALLMIPTVLMGGTLPLLASWLERSTADAGRGSARFYSTNSLGAVFGSGVAGFYLVRNWGMTSSLQLAALVNLLIAVAAILISRNVGDLKAPAAAEPVKSDAPFSAKAAIAMVAITGGVSMGMEVLASRAVALIVGGSLQAFALVLMAFILGIGVGAGIVASKQFARWQNERTVFSLLLGASALIGLFVLGIQQWAIFYSAARYAIAQNEVGHLAHQMLVAFLALGILGAPAALLGAVLPMAIRMGSPSGASLSDQVGRLLTWNTVGAVIGVLVTGFILMPNVGLRGSLGLLALLLAVIATLAAWSRGHFKISYAGIAIIAGLLAISVVGGNAWRHVLGAGLYRIRGSRLTRDMIAKRQDAIQILYYKDAPDATVAVELGATATGPRQTMLRINGKADASSHGDLSTQYLLGHLPLMARPDAKNVFILGFGSGITAGATLGHPIESVTIAENCKPVLEAGKFFEPWNRGVLTNARAHIRNEDARTVLKLSPQNYDVIISEPSNPWVAGIGSVFSREFYQLCSSRLGEGGIMAQWFHIYEMHDGIVELVIRTFSEVFPHIELWDTEGGDIILLGSNKPWESTPAVFQKTYERPQPRADLEEIGLKTPLSILARQIASQRTAWAIAGDGPIQTDEYPVLEYAAPKAFFMAKTADRIFTFDERTRQSALAPEVKRRSLRALPDTILHSAFIEYSTGNAELLRYLKWRAQRVAPGAPHPVYEPEALMPIIFRPTTSFPLDLAEPLHRAEASIVTGAADWQTPVKFIEAELQKNAAALGAETTAQLAGLIAKTALANGEVQQALDYVRLGQVHKLDDPQLQYLKRILDRASK
jgi:spermidine synthase